jgi:hypothetical protein
MLETNEIFVSKVICSTVESYCNMQLILNSWNMEKHIDLPTKDKLSRLPCNSGELNTCALKRSLFLKLDTPKNNSN